MTYKTRVWIIISLVFAAGVGTLLISPIPQDPAYHLFADGRGWLGIPNFANVVSNMGFPVVGVTGFFALYGRAAGRRGVIADTLPLAVFFAGVVLVGAGSAYYHWQPNNETLFWDRLPITLGFMAFTASVVADRVHRVAGLKLILPVLPLIGVASLIYWSGSEAAGRGDLRFYGLVQFLPILLIPIICWLFPAARYTKGRYIAGMILCYGIAKLFEHFDHQVYDLLGNWVSGHTLKHLAAAAAAAFVIPMCRSDDSGKVGSQA